MFEIFSEDQYLNEEETIQFLTDIIGKGKKNRREDEEREYRDIYKKFDDDGNSQITLDEFIKLVKDLRGKLERQGITDGASLNIDEQRTPATYFYLEKVSQDEY